MINNILLVGLGGGAGSILRYLCQRWFSSQYATQYFWGTFLVNIIGCFAIGIIWGLILKGEENNDPLDLGWKLLLMTGLCGGFTTFSAFTWEGIDLLKDHRILMFFLYIGASVVIGLLATYTGIKITR